MRRIALIRLIVAIVLTLNLSLVNAAKVPGYIITNNSDTIFGEIKVTRFDIYTGGFVINGINLEPFHSNVEFRVQKKDHFELYAPGDITGFGFIFKSIHHDFKAFVIESNSLVKSERNRLRFLNLEYQGEISVYCHIIKQSSHFKTHSLTDKVIEYYDYYLFDNDHGLKKVVWKEDFQSLIDLLHHYEIDNTFIKQLPSNIRIKNIIEVLQDYEKWKELDAVKIFKT